MQLWFVNQRGGRVMKKIKKIASDTKSVLEEIEKLRLSLFKGFSFSENDETDASVASNS